MQNEWCLAHRRTQSSRSRFGTVCIVSGEKRGSMGQRLDLGVRQGFELNPFSPAVGSGTSHFFPSLRFLSDKKTDLHRYPTLLPSLVEIETNSV